LVVFRIDFPGSELLQPEAPESILGSKLSGQSPDISVIEKKLSVKDERTETDHPSLKFEEEKTQEVQEVVSIKTRNLEVFDCSIPKLRPDSLKVNLIFFVKRK